MRLSTPATRLALGAVLLPLALGACGVTSPDDAPAGSCFHAPNVSEFQDFVSFGEEVSEVPCTAQHNVQVIAKSTFGCYKPFIRFRSELPATESMPLEARSGSNCLIVALSGELTYEYIDAGPTRPSWAASESADNES